MMNILTSIFKEFLNFRKKIGASFFLASLALPVFAEKADLAPQFCAGIPSSLTIDQTWGGTRVAYSSIESASAVYTAYYDGDRWLSVSEINKCSGKLTKVRLPSRFGGWDPHNYITLSLDSKDRLHVAGNMHISPLIYSRMSRPGDLTSLEVLLPQVGSLEDRVTYPSFFELADGSLAFSYRYGRSGDGTEIINRFDGDVWRRWLDKPLFSSSKLGPKVSAYHTSYFKGPDGNYHVAWIWRKSADVQTNFNINYAYSPDLKNWYSSAGEILVLPLTPDNADVVHKVPTNSGLFNNIRLGFDREKRPVISYLKFDETGATQLWHARKVAGVWRGRPSTRWSYRWNPKGAGNIPTVIDFGGVVWRDGMLLERVRHPDLGNVTLRYDPESLEVDEIMKVIADPSLPKVKVDRRAPFGTVLYVVPVRAGKSKPSVARTISWVSMPADTRGYERKCQPELADCRYLFDLILHSQ